MRRIIENRGYLLVDCTGCSVREISQLCQDFAVACVERQLEHALVKGDGDPQDHLSLRDAFTAMLLAGIASELRIALVARAGPLAAAFNFLARDLCRLRIQAAAFRAVAEAEEWLLQESEGGLAAEDHLREIAPTHSP
jgi:hypothetical protein